MSVAERSGLVRRLALEAGFDEVGIAPAGPVGRAEEARAWLAAGRHGEMSYLDRHRELRVDPCKLLPGARSVIVVAHQYRQARDERTGQDGGPRPMERAGSSGPRGRIARYAWGRDYHRVMRRKLMALADALRAAIGEPFETRVCVDTAPIIEREAGAAAGVGWIGKNTLLIHPRLGSFFFLGEIITTLELPPSPVVTDHCGSCRRCLDACPTGALDAPYRMDARRCIAYLTIEHRGPVPADLQPLMGDWVYGCDVCQDVCPFNAKAPPTREPAYELNDGHPLPPRPPLNVLKEWTAEQHAAQLAGSAMKRATADMLRRNAAIAARNARGGSGTR